MHGQYASGDMEVSGSIRRLLFLSDLHLIFGSWPSNNGVSTGFNTWHWRWSFPMGRIRPMVALRGIDW
jgi:hypothetical protein